MKSFQRKYREQKGASELNRLLDKLRSGDTLVVYELKRLGRNTKQLLALAEEFQANQIEFVSLTEKIDTTTPMGRFVFTTWCALAQLDRDIISENTKSGLAAAKARGRVGGRKPHDKKQVDTALKMYFSNEYSIKEITAATGISKPSFMSMYERRSKKGSLKMPKNNDKLKELLEQAEQGTKAVFESENYRNYLATMSKFHSYSFRNSLLILMQKPEATHVAGYAAWKKKFNRQVQRGESGIQIVGYSPRKVNVEQEKKDSSGNTIIGADGKPVMEKVTRQVPSYVPVSVFDVSQTEGEPLPQLSQRANGSVEAYQTYASNP